MVSTHIDSDHDWKIFKILNTAVKMTNEDTKMHDITTTLKSELAAMQYKKERVQTELQDIKSQLRTKEQRCADLLDQTEELKEQSARQNAIIASLRNRIQELEERERTLNSALSRTEMSVETLGRENRYQLEKVKDLEVKITHLDIDRNSEEQTKKQIQKGLTDIVRRFANALGADAVEFTTTEAILHKAAELIQEVAMLRSRSLTVSESLSSVEVELKSCRDQLDKAYKERESLQRQATSHLIEIDRLKQDKEALDNQLKISEHELAEFRDKYSTLSRNFTNANSDIASQEILIQKLKEEIKLKEQKNEDCQNEIIHLLESLAIITSTPTRFVEPQLNVIKERVREIVHDNKEKLLELEEMRNKYSNLSHESTHEKETRIQDEARIKTLTEDRSQLENRLHRTESELTACEIAKESLKRDKAIFVTFLERLSNVLNMDEISKEVGVDLHTESILLRAEQLAKAENGKVIDKSTVVFQLQRRIRMLRDQLQRRDLHLDLLRKKLNLQEDNSRMRSILENEKEEANMRVKKLQKQVEKLQNQLTEARTVSRDLRSQLNESEEYKGKALERAQQIEDLQKRLIDSEMLRTRYLQKVSALKDQLRITTENSEQDKTMNERTVKLLKDELISLKQNLAELHRTDNLLSDFRRSIVTLLGVDTSIPDYEIVSRLSKLVNAHREYTLVSRRYDDPLSLSNALSPRYSTSLEHHPLGTRFSTSADKSRYIDNLLDDIDADINAAYNKRPTRTL